MQCYTFCIHVITLHSSLQSQLLPFIFLNLHSTLLNILYSVFFLLKKILVFLLLEHCILPKDFWSCSLNGMAMVFGQDPLFPCIGELFHLNLLVFCSFKFFYIISYNTIQIVLIWQNNLSNLCKTKVKQNQGFIVSCFTSVEVNKVAYSESAHLSSTAAAA